MPHVAHETDVRDTRHPPGMTPDDVHAALEEATARIISDHMPPGLDWTALASVCHEATRDLEPHEAAALGAVAGYLLGNAPNLGATVPHLRPVA